MRVHAVAILFFACGLGSCTKTDQPLDAGPINDDGAGPINDDDPGQVNDEDPQQDDDEGPGQINDDDPQQNDDDFEYAIPKDAYGVWDKPGKYMNDECPDFIKGHGVHIEWTQLQPDGPEEFEFSKLTEKIRWAKDHKKYVYLKVYPLDNDPVGWMPEHGVALNTIKGNNGKSYTYPDYTDEDYLTLYQNMVEGVAKWVFVDLKEQGLRQTISHLFVQVGVSGDPKPYHDWSHNDKLPAEAQLDDDAHWERLKFKMMKIYNQAFHNNVYDDVMPFYFNSVGISKKEEWEWMINNVPKYGIKPNNAPARGHILSDQANDVHNYSHLVIDPPKGKLMFLKNESDTTYGREIASENREMYSFWAVLNALQVGLSIVDANKNSLQDVHHDSWRFFDKYNASLFPQKSPNAYIFFHFGLDTTDYDRFPDEGEFAGKDNDIDRGKAIAKAYAELGARPPAWEKVVHKKTGKIIDWHYLMSGQVDQRHYATNMQDVGKNIWRSNFNRYIEEIDFLNNSYPLWRVGKEPGSLFTSQDSKYCRYGRGINSNKHSIYLKFSKDFFTTVLHGEQCNNAEYKVILEVRYFDNEEGKWELGYDSTAGDKYWTCTKKGSGEYRVETITITDGYFGKRGPKGSDFWLSDAKDSDEDIFSSIEIRRDLQ